MCTFTYMYIYTYIMYTYIYAHTYTWINKCPPHLFIKCPPHVSSSPSLVYTCLSRRCPQQVVPPQCPPCPITSVLRILLSLQSQTRKQRLHVYQQGDWTLWRVCGGGHLKCMRTLEVYGDTWSVLLPPARYMRVCTHMCIHITHTYIMYICIFAHIYMYAHIHIYTYTIYKHWCSRPP